MLEKKRRAIAIIICVVFALALFFSFDFIIENTNHECSGDHCPICAVLQVAEEISGGTKKAVVSMLISALFIVAIYIIRRQINISLAAVTPISLNDILTI